MGVCVSECDGEVVYMSKCSCVCELGSKILV